MSGLLDEPIEVRLPKGYLFCTNCHDYEHHALVYCKRCGNKLIREKKMTWREFLYWTAKCGSGPINTIYHLLGGWKVEKLSPVHDAVYREAEKEYARGKARKVR